MGHNRAGENRKKRLKRRENNENKKIIRWLAQLKQIVSTLYLDKEHHVYHREPQDNCIAITLPHPMDYINACYYANEQKLGDS